VHGVNHGHATGQSGKNRSIIGINHLSHGNFRCDGISAFVGAGKSDVGMGIYDARHQISAVSFNNSDSGRGGEILTDLFYYPVDNQNIAIGNSVAGDGQNSGIFNQEVATSQKPAG